MRKKIKFQINSNFMRNSTVRTFSNVGYDHINYRFVRIEYGDIYFFFFVRLESQNLGCHWIMRKIRFRRFEIQFRYIASSSFVVDDSASTLRLADYTISWLNIIKMIR